MSPTNQLFQYKRTSNLFYIAGSVKKKIVFIGVDGT